MAIKPLTVIEEDDIYWPHEWDTELARKTRYPRRASHWFASHRSRRTRLRAFCAELDALIARRIRFERVAAGLRQIDLAEAIGVTQSMISRLESGKSPASFADIVRIAIQLNRPLEVFVSPPREGRKTGWERHPTKPLISWDVMRDAEEGKLPIDHPMYD